MGIRIYWVDIRSVDPASPEIRALMSENRRRKLAEPALPDERRRSIAAELALVFGMAREQNGKASPVEWTKGFRGKPFLPEGCLHFSLSHASDAAVCAIADAPVGVDIERQRSISRGLRRKLLAPSETDAPDELLLWKWVAKESYLKLTGEGLARPMAGFSAEEGRISDGDGRALACVQTIPFVWPDYTLCVSTPVPEAAELIRIPPEWAAGGGDQAK